MMRLLHLFAVILSSAPLAVFAGGKEELEYLNQNCFDHDKADKLQMCERLLEDPHVRPIWHSGIYQEMADAAPEMRGRENEIFYLERAVEAYAEASRVARSLPADGRDLQWLGAVNGLAASNEMLGNVQQLGAMELYLDQSFPAATALAKSALSSFSTAIAVGHKFHSAYASRAELLSTMCRPDDAKSDMNDAIRIATSDGDMEAAEKYERETLSSCWEEFKKQECASDTVRTDCPSHP
jgi:hypothetical protein